MSKVAKKLRRLSDEELAIVSRAVSEELGRRHEEPEETPSPLVDAAHRELLETVGAG